jgi:hypothetical protein
MTLGEVPGLTSARAGLDVGRPAVALPGAGLTLSGLAPFWSGGGRREVPCQARRPPRARGSMSCQPSTAGRPRRGPQPGAVHEPVVVVPVDPGTADLLDLGQGAKRAAAERRSVPDALRFAQSYGCFSQGVIVSVPDRPDRPGQPGEHQGLGEADGCVLTAAHLLGDHLAGLRLPGRGPGDRWPRPDRGRQPGQRRAGWRVADSSAPPKIESWPLLMLRSSG